MVIVKLLHAISYHTKKICKTQKCTLYTLLVDDTEKKSVMSLKGLKEFKGIKKDDKKNCNIVQPISYHLPRSAISSQNG